ncbi:MAG: GNAT family N-acetyltransferase [Flavobacteriaceae bacterium]
MKFDFNKTLTLENDCVLLRCLEQNDFEKLLPFSENEPHLWSFSLTPASGAKNLKNYINKAIESRVKEEAYPFVVIDKKRGAVAGCTRFYGIDLQHDVLSLGYTWYGKEFQRTGLNRNCKYLLLTYAFETLKCERVEFRADLRNKKSIESMKSIGCTVEGVLRNNCKAAYGRRDSTVLSILRDEWEQKVKKQLESKLY